MEQRRLRDVEQRGDDSWASAITALARSVGTEGGNLTADQMYALFCRSTRQPRPVELLMLAVVWQALADLGQQRDGRLRDEAALYFSARRARLVPVERDSTWCRNFPFIEVCAHFGLDQQAVCAALGVTGILCRARPALRTRRSARGRHRHRRPVKVSAAAAQGEPGAEKVAIHGRGAEETSLRRCMLLTGVGE